MPSKFERFTKRARRVLQLAQEEAERLNSSVIGTEHLLVGLLREDSGVGARLLKEQGVTLPKVRAAVERRAGKGSFPFQGRTELAERTKRVIELAVDEARQLRNRYIGTEHLLLGIVKEGQGIAAGILRGMGVTERIVRENLMLMSLQPSPDPGQTKKAPGKSKSLIEELGVNLTEQARRGELDPVIGREKEIERVIQILSRRTKNNPALIGEPGVGKTAIVEGIAQRIVLGDIPETLAKKRLVRLDVGSLVAGTMYRGQFEERLNRVIDEIKTTDTVLFIDELHMLVGAGSAGSSVDAANILKPALARGELQCIGATTLKEYRKYIESDAALERRFQPIMIEESSVEETIEILKGIRSRYEEHHKLHITDEALHAAAHLAARYVTDRYLPDKAVDLVDEAASRVRVFKAMRPEGLRKAFRELQIIQREKETAFGARKFEDAVDLRDRELLLQTQLQQLRLGWEKIREAEELKVTAEDIAEILSMWTGIPVARIQESESDRLLRMEDALHERIIGQDEAISTVAKAVRRARAGLKDPRRPIGSFIFLGPTGVGKTELAKALAAFMFGSEDALLQFDMSEFAERHTVARLVGAPPGYVGYDEAGQLTEAIRRRPYSVICFDEIEKAHPETFNMLLQIMEDGRLSDAKGHLVDFKNTIVIMTSNVAADVLNRETSLGFALTRDEARSEEVAYQHMKEKILVELKRAFRPEFLNRLDSIVVFRRLSKEQIRTIVDLHLNDLQERLREHAITIRATEEGRELLAQEGYDPQFGARPLRRVFQRLVEDPLSEAILSREISDGDTVLIEQEDGQLKVQREERADEEKQETLLNAVLPS
ncbi:MAG: ATP-dependent Clp protease ATP-binding subunit [Chloroflexota bacterium]|nr:ATP-dependent Clp protease ATP-binding subunit [Anaerolineae bacterium]